MGISRYISSEEATRKAGSRRGQLDHERLDPAQCHPGPTLRQTFTASSPRTVSFCMQRKNTAAVGAQPTSSSLRCSFARSVLPHFAEPSMVLPDSPATRSALSQPRAPLGRRKART
ncbi:hypothetical protein OPT61_g9176 [Boeremia exigua]|uniref:Uncharacterized protein n=1 Tax=Boeremia exigua TaxID=749465 RepID=A0ACC2HV91_9PLEO|nr:hypothetical protein OPT61_g9176 [Boeremia exigua]